MSKTAHIVWTCIGLSIVAALLVAATVWGVVNRPADQPCVSLSFIIKDRADRLYVTENELTQLLRAEELYPVGRKVDVGTLHRIELAVLHHPMVRTAQCYLTPRNEVRVQLTQRVPLLRVVKADETYFIDTDRRVMPVRAAVQDKVLTVTGTVGTRIASTQLADFALWLQDMPYWQQHTRYLQVQSPQMIYLYLNKDAGLDVKGERIVLGSMRNFERKLKKMHTFFDNSADILKEKNYVEYDARYKGQVIGRY